MKKFCQKLEDIPKAKEIVCLTQREHLVLEFPHEVFNANSVKNTVIASLKKELPESYSIFDSGGRVKDNTSCITIMPVVKTVIIENHIDECMQALFDYITISNCLSTENSSKKNQILRKEWQLTEEDEHKTYIHIHTGQVLRTSSYLIENINNIDPYFFSQFIKTSTQYDGLNKIIEHNFHDASRLLEYIEKYDLLLDKLPFRNN